MLPAFDLTCSEEWPAEHPCVMVWWQAPTFWASAFVFRDGLIHNPVMWLGSMGWAITPAAENEALGETWYGTWPPVLVAA